MSFSPKKLVARRVLHALAIVTTFVLLGESMASGYQLPHKTSHLQTRIFLKPWQVQKNLLQGKSILINGVECSPAPVLPTDDTSTVKDTHPYCQSINFSPASALNLIQTPYGLSASATSGLPVSFTSNSPSVCTVNGNALALIAEGTCAVTASQAGDSTWGPAAPVTANIAISKAPQSISFNPVTSLYRIDGTYTLSASASSTQPVTFSSTTTSVCTVSGNALTLVATGPCSVAADQSGNQIWAPAAQVVRNINILVKPQSITGMPANLSRDLTANTYQFNATASSGLQISYSASPSNICSIDSNGKLTLIALGDCTVTASQPGNIDWSPATPSSTIVSITTTATTPSTNAQSITFAPASTLFYSTSLYGLVATATSGLPVTFSTTSTGICTISGLNLTLLSVGICSITASQPGNSSYAAAAVVIAGIQITPAPQTITFASIGSALQVPGTETLVANASSNLPVTFTTASAGICSVAGDILSAMSAGSCVVVASQAGGGNWQAAEPKTQTISITISTDPPARVTPLSVTSNVAPIISGTTPQLGRPIVLPVTRVRNPFIPTKRFSVSAKLSDRVTNYATVTQLTGKLTLIHIPHDAGTKLRLNSGVANSVAGRLKLNVTTDGLEVTALNGWTGRISIPVIATVNGVEIELWIAVVEIPGVVISPLFYFNTQNKVTVNWAPDGSQVLAYNLYLDNSPICTTSQTSCTLTTIATPVTAHSNLLIEAIGRQATYSLKIAPVFVTKRVLTAEVVHFATSSSALAPSDSRSLTSFAQAAINLGAKTVQIAGFTDTAGNSAINRPLSIARANVVAAYLKKLLPHFKFIIKGNSSGMPVSSNNSANGRANNRRVEVTVA